VRRRGDVGVRGQQQFKHRASSGRELGKSLEGIAKIGEKGGTQKKVQRHRTGPRYEDLREDLWDGKKKGRTKRWRGGSRGGGGKKRSWGTEPSVGGESHSRRVHEKKGDLSKTNQWREKKENLRPLVKLVARKEGEEEKSNNVFGLCEAHTGGGMNTGNGGDQR